MATPAPPAPAPAEEFGEPAPRRRGAALGRLVVALLVLAVAGGGIWLVNVASTPRPAAERRPVGPPIEAVQVQPGSAAPAIDVAAAPATGPAPQPQAGQPAKDPLGEWAGKFAPANDLPLPAVRAYAVAELAMRAEKPGCRLSWTTLAGIGRIESNHGRYGGLSLGEDGRPSKPIIGIPLDGSPGVRAIPDTDKGALDGDPKFDRAVGPMQFIPGTWRKYASDADGDGKADPQNINDAAAAAARYLCSSGRDLSTGQGWWAAVMAYNNSVEYGQKVFGLADAYAKLSRK